MLTITIPKIEYKQLQRIKQKYEAIRQLFRADIFEEPSTKNVKKIIKEFRSTGLYKKEFLQSLEKGLKESSYFERC